MKPIAAVLGLAIFCLAGCTNQADNDAAYMLSQTAVQDIVCATDRTDVSLGLEQFAVAVGGLDPETREATIDDLVTNTECPEVETVVVPAPPEGFTLEN